MLTIEKVEGARSMARRYAGDRTPVELRGNAPRQYAHVLHGMLRDRAHAAGEAALWLRRAGADNDNYELGLDKIEKK